MDAKDNKSNANEVGAGDAIDTSTGVINDLGTTTTTASSNDNSTAGTTTITTITTASSSNDNSTAGTANNDNAGGITRKRSTLTGKQVARLESLSDEDLLPESLRAMGAMVCNVQGLYVNRERFADRSFAERLTAQILKREALINALLDALVDAGLAQVEVFTTPRAPNAMSCQCGRRWEGTAFCTWCRQSLAKPDRTADTQYVVTCSGHRFGQTAEKATERMRKVARLVPPPDVRPPFVHAPKVGLTVRAQFHCIRLMIKRLARRKAA